MLRIRLIVLAFELGQKISALEELDHHQQTLDPVEGVLVDVMDGQHVLVATERDCNQLSNCVCSLCQVV